MIKSQNLIPAQLEESESIRKLGQRSLLETLLYHSLIEELEKHLITNKEPYLLKTVVELNEYPELIFFLSPGCVLSDNDKVRCYFHLEGVEVEPNNNLRKVTAEDNMHKNILFTLVYL